MKYFKRNGLEWEVADVVRRMVRFQQTDLRQIPRLLGPFDLVLCRNVLIYFDLETKLSIFERLAKVMEPDGMLMLGAAETVVGVTDAFKPYPDRRGLYQPNLARAARPGLGPMQPALKIVAAR